MVSCAVVDCQVNSRHNPNKHTFHRFPKNPLLRDKWLRITDRSRWTPAKNSCVCSKHFESKYFIQRKHRRVLMRGSIPTLFVPVQLKNRRQCSYVNRDISPPPGPPGPVLSLREKKLINRCSNLKKKVLQKNKLLRNLKAKSKRISIQLLNLQALVKDLYKRLEHEHHKNEILPDPDLIKVEMT